MEGLFMLTEKEIEAIQELMPEEQLVVMSLVNSFKNSKAKNEMQIFLEQTRNDCLITNPMSMEEIDKVIHDGEQNDNCN